MSWTAGYVTELDYTHGYYPDLNPAMLRLACVSAGAVPPPPGPLSYLELGFGQGVSINIHAAAFAGTFWGNDFIPAHAAHARALAGASGSGAVLTDDSFAELAARPDLPEFDIIALHGVWSWVSAENRRIIVDLIRRRLRVGGLVYISYNCLPAWAAALPLRHILTLHAELAGSPASGILNRIDGALAFAQRVADNGANFFKANPAVTDWLKTITRKDRDYLAHEYFNRDWAVMPFSDVAAALDEAKLTFVGSANFLDQVDRFNLSEEAQKLLAEIQHPVLRQSVRDYFTNQQFRRDIFVKGLRPLSSHQRDEALRAQSFALLKMAKHPITTSCPLGAFTLEEGLSQAILDILAERDFAPKTGDDIARHPKLGAMPFANVVTMILSLIGTGHIHPAQMTSLDAHRRCKALNRYVCDRSRNGSSAGILASPVTGAGIHVERFQQLFVLALQDGKRTTADQARFVWDCLVAQGQRLMRDGGPLDSAEDSVAELTLHAEAFAKSRLPLLTALGVA